MAKPYPLKIKKQPIDFTKEISKWINEYKDSKDDFDIERVKINELYLENRNELLETTRGKFVFVTPNEIVITNQTSIDYSKDNPKKNTWGIWFKVGEELGIPSKSYFSTSTDSLSKNICLPVTFGQRNNDLLWFTDNCMVDTGCDTTTFNESVLQTIKNIYPDFKTTRLTTNVVGGTTTVDQGVIDIDFCNKQYTIFVNFAKISILALIGMDLMNDGNLFYDVKGWISFTRH